MIVGSLLWLTRALPLNTWQQTLEHQIASLGAVGPVAFALIYLMATLCLVPGWVLTVTAGAIFGLSLGFVTVSTSSVIAATTGFFISRYLARAKVERMAETNPKFRAMDRVIRDGGWKIVALTRLSRVVPFSLQNYVYGLTAMRWSSFCLTTWLAMMPGIFAYVYLGSVARTAVAGERTRLGQAALMGIGIAATVAMTIYITRLTQQKLREVSDSDESFERTRATAPPRPALLLLYVVTATVLFVLAAALQVRTLANTYPEIGTSTTSTSPPASDASILRPGL